MVSVVTTRHDAGVRPRLVVHVVVVVRGLEDDLFLRRARQVWSRPAKLLPVREERVEREAEHGKRQEGADDGRLWQVHLRRAGGRWLAEWLGGS